MISTRDTPIFTPAHVTKLVSDTISKFDENKTCPSDIAIYIHGFNKDARMMLERNLIEYKHH